LAKYNLISGGNVDKAKEKADNANYMTFMDLELFSTMWEYERVMQREGRRVASCYGAATHLLKLFVHNAIGQWGGQFMEKEDKEYLGKACK